MSLPKPVLTGCRDHESVRGLNLPEDASSISPDASTELLSTMVRIFMYSFNVVTSTNEYGIVPG
jgi:hypothetical protein